MQPPKPPTPRISKYYGGLLNISSWIHKNNEKNVTEIQKYVDNIFDHHQWDVSDDYIAKMGSFRTKKMYWPKKDKKKESSDDDMIMDNEMIVDGIIEIEEEKETIIQLKIKFIE